MHLRAISAFVFAASLGLTSTALGLVTSGETRLWATTAGWTIAGLAFGAAALAVAVRVSPGRVRTAWLLWAAASAFWVAGAVGRGVLGSASSSLPVPTFADALWCLFAVVSVAGIAVRSARGSFSFPLYALDALPVVLLAAALAQLPATRHSHPSHAHDAFALAYPIVFVFLALVSTQLITLQGFRRAWRRGTVAFMGGFYLLAAGAVTWAPQTLDGSRVDTFVPGLLWTLGLFVLAGYALFRALQPAGAAPYYAPERDRGARSIPPAAAIGGLILLDILVPEGAPAEWLLLAAASAFGARSFLVRQATGHLLDALAAERDFTSAVIETAGSLVCVIDHEGRFVRFNRSCEDVSGRTRDEVMGRPFYELVIPPEEQEEVAARFARARAGEFPNEGENHWVTRSGERRLISWKNTALLGADGLVRYVVGTGIDVTEQRRAEEALARNEERFRTLVANVPGAVFRCALDEHWTMEFLSDGIEEVTGYPASDFIGNRVRTYASVTHPEDGPKVDQVIFEAAAGRRPYALEYRVLHADGSVRWVFERGKAHYGADGSVLWLDSVLLDVTERKQVEDALAERERQLSAVFENLPGVVYRCAYELPWTVSFFSDEIERMLGRSPAEFAEKFGNFAAAMHPDDRAPVDEARRAAAESREPYALEYRCIRSDGAERWISDRGRAAYGPEGEVLCLDGVLFDITELRRAEKELKDSERRFQALLESAPEGVLLVDADGRIVFANAQTERLFGYQGDELLGLPVEILLPEQARESHVRHLSGYHDDARLRRKGQDLDMAGRRQDGSEFPIDVSRNSIESEHGQLVIALVRDLTEPRRLEQSLREAEEKYRTLVEQLPLVTYMNTFETPHRLLYVSPQVEAILGYSADELHGDPALLVASLHPEDRERVLGEAARLRKEGGEYFSEYRLFARDGRVVRIEDASVIVRDDDDTPLYVQGFLLDVTEQKRAEEALRETTQTLEGLIDASPIPIVALDREGLVTLWNPASERTFGWTAAEVLGRPNPIPGPDYQQEFAARLAQVLRGESWRDLEIVRRRRDGSALELSASSGPLRNAEGEAVGMVSLLVDVTERKLAEVERERLLAALSEQNERLLELDGLKEEFVALVSHELRTPLTSIRGYLELIMDGEVGDVTPEQAEFLGIVDRNALRLLRLVGDLLLVAQLESGAMNLILGEVDLRALAVEAVAANAPIAEREEITLALEAAEVPAFQADRSRLAQVIDNFLSNAIKFTPRGGGITVRVEPLPGAVAIEVADTGMGMTPDETEMLFQRFFRTAEATRQAIPGTGLGLAITKGIVEAHEGTISVESEQGAGTTFRVVLPTVATGRAAVDNAVVEKAA